MNTPDIAALFPGIGKTIYLNSASTGLGCQPAVEAFRTAAEAWGEGRFDFTVAEQAGEEARVLFAEMINAPADCVALIPTASAVAGQVAAHLRALGGGGNILVGEQEYTSALFPFLQLREQGFEIRLLPFVNGGVSAEQFAAAADANTRLIVVSAVQSASGYRVDLAALREIADRSKALVYVDAAQLCGALTIDAAGLGIDALAAPAHKFLIGTRGMGYGYFAPALRDAMQPVAPGWKAAVTPLGSFYGPEMALSKTASRFDQSLAWFNALADRESLKVMQGIGFQRIAAINAGLANHLRARLIAAGIDFLDHGPERGSAIFSLLPAIDDAAAVLARAGVVAAVRGGRVRLSLHFYNDAEQIDRVVSLLSR